MIVIDAKKKDELAFKFKNPNQIFLLEIQCIFVSFDLVGLIWTQWSQVGNVCVLTVCLLIFIQKMVSDEYAIIVSILFVCVLFGFGICIVF